MSKNDQFGLSILNQSHRISKLHTQSRTHGVMPAEEYGFDFLGINVPSTYQQGLIPDGEEPPWGFLRVVATAREKFGFKAGLLDAHRLRLQPEQIGAQIKAVEAKLVGLNPTSVNVPEAIAIAQVCDRIGVPYILGGIHATLDLGNAVQDFPNAFAIVRGNGEIAIGEILSVASRGTEKRLSGIWYQGQDLLPVTEYAPKLAPDDIPMVRQDVYIEEPLYRHTIYHAGAFKEVSEATLFVTYGCPFECTFCASPIMVNRGNDVPYARPEVARILDEVEHVVSGLGADAVHFLDDMAFISGGNIRDFYLGLASRDLLGKFMWRGLTRAPVILRRDFNDEVMDMMQASGAWKIALGVESGNDVVLKRIKKKVATHQVVQAVQKLVRFGIQPKGFFVLGFPGETRSQIEDTVRFIADLKTIGMTEAGIFQFKPYPGTEEFGLLVAERPDLVPQLSYLKRTYTDLAGRARESAENHVWLPDDLRIAEIPSGEVRAYITGALEAFYGSSFSGILTSPCA